MFAGLLLPYAPIFDPMLSPTPHLGAIALVHMPDRTPFQIRAPIAGNQALTILVEEGCYCLGHTTIGGYMLTS